MVTKDELLQVLPPFTNKGVIIEDKQEVHGIIKEVINAHKFFENDYNFIYQYFDKGSVKDICQRLFSFSQKNVAYQVEGEDLQTTKSPAALLALGVGDCKHYAGFIGGVLSAINRNTDRNIKWFYRFASYSIWNESVEHVFVVVIDRGKEIWIDPVLGYFDSREVVPVHVVNKKINDIKMLKRISGTLGLPFFEGQPGGDTVPVLVPFDSTYLIANAATPTVNLPAVSDDIQTDIPDYLVEAIKMLLYYGIIDVNLNVYNDKYMDILEGLVGQDQTDLSNAYGQFLDACQLNVVGNIFKDI